MGVARPLGWPRAVARGGWEEEPAAKHFDESVAIYGIDDAVPFVLEETTRLSTLYPSVLVAPLLYRVEDDRLLQIGHG